MDLGLIDEIDTNNETDEACLQYCVEKWVSRLEPSWERLSLVLGYLGDSPSRHWKKLRRVTQNDMFQCLL